VREREACAWWGTAGFVSDGGRERFANVVKTISGGKSSIGGSDGDMPMRSYHRWYSTILLCYIYIYIWLFEICIYIIILL
jgi:hypothetical protein